MGLGVAVGLALLGVTTLAVGAPCEDLVRVGRSAEAGGDPDHALRAYTDAVALDPTCREAYLRLGAIRESRNDLREADRVYSVALQHVAGSRELLLRRAAVLLALGREEGLVGLRALAESDDEDDEAVRVALDALHRLDDWFVAHDYVAARLGAWRRISVLADRRGDAPLSERARTMVRALSLVVADADPVTVPSGGSGLRRLIAKKNR